MTLSEKSKLHLHLEKLLSFNKYHVKIDQILWGQCQKESDVPEVLTSEAEPAGLASYSAEGGSGDRRHMKEKPAGQTSPSSNHLPPYQIHLRHKVYQTPNAAVHRHRCAVGIFVCMTLLRFLVETLACNTKCYVLWNKMWNSIIKENNSTGVRSSCCDNFKEFLKS